MSGEIALWAARQDIKNHAAKMVLIALGDAFDDRTGLCFPSHESLCDFVRRGETQVKEAVRWLEGEGWIKREARFDKSGRRSSNGYEIIFTRGETFLAMVDRRTKTRGERAKRVFENCTKEGANLPQDSDTSTGGGKAPGIGSENRPSRGVESRPPLTESLLNK